MVFIYKNLPEIKNWVYKINLDKCESIGTHWISGNMNGDNVTYFDSFAVEYILKEITKFINNRNIITNIYRIQACNSITCRYFCNRFIDFMLKEQKFVRVYQFILS